MVTLCLRQLEGQGIDEATVLPTMARDDHTWNGGIVAK